MSTESAKLFMDRMKTDDEFAKKITKCRDAASLKEFLQAAGYDFTPEEAKEGLVHLNDDEMRKLLGYFMKAHFHAHIHSI